MGVTGLWRLIEPAGKPVPVETLENKVLAVDISIWLHQMVKGYQDAKGAPLPNAHLIGLFQRLCKLLYFRIKPVFVFDGGFPELKKETIAKRQDHKAKYHSESERLKRELALLLSKKTAVSSLLGKQISPKKGNAADVNNDDIFKLPALPQKDEETESESEEESSGAIMDLHSIDVESENFKNLPIKEKYDLLIELKETRKMNSWGKLHELPKKSDNFSDFQMQRLLKRRKLQECLEETEKEMGSSGMSLNDLESLLNEEGIDTKIDNLPTRRIASNNNTRFLLINNVREALAEAKRKEAENNTEAGPSKTEIKPPLEEKPAKKDELEDDLERAIKMSLECVDEAETSDKMSKTDDSWTSVLTDTDYSDSEEEDGFQAPDMFSAKAYIKQYTDLTEKAIDEIVTKHKTDKTKASKVPNADKIIDELKKETYVKDNIELSSSEDECAYVSPSSKDLDEVHNKSVVELNTTCEDEPNVNATQASVVYVENPGQDIIFLDTSTEDDSKETSKLSSQFEMGQEIKTKSDEVTQKESNKESESSDDEFVEVLEEENQANKHVIELTLNMGDAPENDIFADIFTVEPEKETVTKDIVEQSTQFPLETVSLGKCTTNKNDNELFRSELEKDPKTISTKQTVTAKGVRVKEVVQNHDEIVPESSNDNRETINPNIDNDICKSKQDTQNEHTTNHEKDNINPTNTKPISVDELNTMAEVLNTEEQDLMSEKGRLDRIGRNITEQMTKEAQELLQIFGIPYIVAPMEAEAQCAFLESVNLTDGTITDDSDIWLFGGRTVYKNFFNQKKHVLQFLAERIEKSFNLTREQLILLALLVGSDYTTGVTGIGPVTAMEILASFPFNKKQVFNESSKQAQSAHMISGLQEFKKWVRAGKRTDNITLKKKLKNVNLNEDFPSVQVVQAYLEPNIEKSEEKFTWGELDITILRDYAKAKFGWSQNKLDEIIKPVLKRIQDRKSQRSVQDYFKKKIEFQSLEDQMSKRVKAAVQKMGPEGLITEKTNNKSLPGDGVKVARKRRANKKGDKCAIDGIPGPSSSKLKNTEEEVLIEHNVKVVSQLMKDGKSGIEINIPKTTRVQEIIPQREKEKHDLLQNKMKAIEIFRKTKIDRKRKITKRKPNLPKEKAELSESSDND